MNFPKIFLKPGKEVPVRRFHPWVFSGAIQRAEGNPADGEHADRQLLHETVDELLVDE